ncbi:MAG: endonuclease, partial [Bacilli bacterium]|nr:endonuclease [Bacilli bacterium]
MPRFKPLTLALCMSIASLGAFVGLSFASDAKKALEVYADGPTSGGSVPTNLTLRDNTTNEIKSYYSSLEGLDDSELQGENLLKNLRPILQNFNYYSYDNCWKIYEITDRDWTLSPATGISGYNDSTKQVTGYKYGESYENPYVHPLYRNRDEFGVPIEAGRLHAWGDHNDSGINREHVWCQSRGFKKDNGAGGPAGTDIHHLMSGDGYVNMTPHNNNPYGFVDRSSIKNDAGSHETFGVYLEGNLSGAPTTKRAASVSKVVFEPQDCDKGDIARACFYMAACYNNISGTETIDQFNPNLKLVDYATSSSKSEISTAETPVTMGILSDLLAWHKLDPVDEYEKHRNNLIYNNYQHNRNPFIDYPEWVDYIWGRATYDENAHRVTAFDPNPTGHVDLDSDVIYGYRGGDIPFVPDEPEIEAVWQKADSVAIGDEIMLVYEDGSKAVKSPFNAVALNGISTAETKYGTHEGIVLEQDERKNKFFNHSNAYTLLLEEGSQEGTFALKNRQGQYIGHTGSKNTLNQYKEITVNTSWSITIADDGNATIENCANTNRLLEWNNAEGQFRFAAYLGTCETPQIYKLDAEYEASQWAANFIENWTAGCNPEGGYDGSLMHWDDAEEAYGGLARNTQALIREKTKDESTIWSAVECYDYIVAKYGTSTFADFLERNPTPKANNRFETPLVSQNNGGFAVVFAIICGGLALVSITMIIRRFR